MAKVNWQKHKPTQPPKPLNWGFILPEIKLTLHALLHKMISLN